MCVNSVYTDMLFLVSTPIGNLEDITYRAVKTLSSSDIILCEDTRHASILLQHYGITTRTMSFYDEIEEKRLPDIIQRLESGKNIALISDAGTPLISDPGFRLVRECRNRGIPVTAIPGPTAAITAFILSGFPLPFTFYGYPPEKQSHRLKLFTNLGQTSCIFYCGPHKLQKTLGDLSTVCGDIEIVIARELTKIHEEIWTGKISDALSKYSSPKGEFVLLFHVD